MRDQMISFQGKERPIDAYLVHPDSTPKGVVIVLHEIWGLDAHIKDVARRFSHEGYVALAPDMFSGPFKEAAKPDNIMAGMMFLRTASAEIQRDPAKLAEALSDRSADEQAALKTLMQIMSPAQRTLFAEELTGAFEYLRGQDVPQNHIASLGFCFGGGLAIHMATFVSKLWKTVIFYGENPPLDKVPAIQAQVLGLYGGKDARITDTVPEFQRAMEALEKPFTYKVYGGAQHAFFNNTRPMHNPAAAEDAWHEVLRFLDHD